jgi:ABC-type transport system involved in multi-copper enzyme maturation permease subunit
MSAVAASPSLQTSQAPVPRAARPSFGLLTRVELRKTVDTRAGRILLAGILVLCAAVVGYGLLEAGTDKLAYGGWVSGAATPATLLLPVLGVLAMSSEWTQRTALSTFTLTPRRLRVLTAKFAAAVVLGVVVTLAVDALAALGLVVRAAMIGGTVTWGSVPSAVGGSIVASALALVMGAALGALIMQSAAAIVAYFVAPNAATLAGGVLFHDGVKWFDVGGTFDQLQHFDVSGHAGPIATTLLIWIVLPLAAGLWRSARRNVS